MHCSLFIKSKYAPLSQEPGLWPLVSLLLLLSINKQIHNESQVNEIWSLCKISIGNYKYFPQHSLSQISRNEAR